MTQYLGPIRGKDVSIWSCLTPMSIGGVLQMQGMKRVMGKYLSSAEKGIFASFFCPGKKDGQFLVENTISLSFLLDQKELKKSRSVSAVRGILLMKSSIACSGCKHPNDQRPAAALILRCIRFSSLHKHFAFINR